MRQSIGGYFDAVVDEARINNQLERMASELRSVQELIDGHDELKAVLTDPGVSVATRRAVVTDLLQTRLSGDALRAILFAIGADPATELHDDLAWMASRADAMAGRQATPRPIEAIVLGRDAAKERLVGYTVATLEPHDDATIRRVEEELFSFMQIVDASAELRDALSNRDLTPAARHSLVTELLEGRATPATVSLATYATRVGRPRDYQELLAHLVEVVGQEADRRVAEVHVPVELDTAERERLAAALAQVTGRTTEVRPVLDASVLGGFVATMGDTVVDGSVRRKLQLLRSRLEMPEQTTTIGGVH